MNSEVFVLCPLLALAVFWMLQNCKMRLSFVQLRSLLGKQFLNVILFTLVLHVLNKFDACFKKLELFGKITVALLDLSKGEKLNNFN